MSSQTKLCNWKWTLWKTKEAFKNGQPRDTGNIEHTRHRTMTNKTQKSTTQHRKLNRWTTRPFLL